MFLLQYCRFSIGDSIKIARWIVLNFRHKLWRSRLNYSYFNYTQNIVLPYLFHTFPRFWFSVTLTGFQGVLWATTTPSGQEATWELVRSMCSASYPNRVRTINLTMRIKTFNTVKETGGGGGGVQSMGKRFEKKILRILIYFD